MNHLSAFLPKINELCKQYKVKTLYAFGSVLSDKFNAKSDIDFIVDFANIPVDDYADNYFDFKFSLQDILKRQIDLLEEQAIKNPYFRKSISEKKELIYG